MRNAFTVINPIGGVVCRGNSVEEAISRFLETNGPVWIWAKKLGYRILEQSKKRPRKAAKTA